MSRRQPPVCPHCLELAEHLRTVGHLVDANSIHYAMAAVIEAQREGHTVEELADVIRAMGQHTELRRVPVSTDDVTIVDRIPRAAVVAQVIEMARGERNV